MKGLEVSEVRLSYVKQIDIFRLDSFFYLKRFLFAENNINKLYTDYLHNLCSSILSFGAYSLNNFVNYKSEGIPFIRGVNMKNGVLDFSDVIYIDEYAHKLLWKSEVKPETILLSMSGNIGDVAIAMPCYQYPMNSNQDIAKLRVNKKINVYYLYVFLLSKYGQDYLIREARGSVQQHVFLSQMEKFVIPIMPQSFQLQIEQMVKSAHAKLEESKQLYAAAEDQLLSELGLKDWQPKNDNINVKTLKESFLSSGRLDAEYYQSKYDEIEREIASYYDALEIGNLCFVNQKNTKPKDGVQYKYIELSNINTIGEITGCTIDYGENLPTRARQVVKSGDVIVSSIEGSLDSCALVTPEYDNAFCSTGFYIIRSKIITSETLLVLMKLKPIQQLLKKGCSGTILTAINYDNFCNIIIPVPDGKIQTEISSKIQRCFALKAESKCLLEEAKLMVEQEIEKVGK